MKLSNIVNESAYCSIGCITKLEDIDTLERFVLHNLPVISKFEKIVVAHTKTDNVSQQQLNDYNNIWTKHFGDKCLVINRKNHGHTFGFVDLDRTVISESKKLGCKWVWKSTNDILITEAIFNVEIGDSEFLFLQGHGITGIQTYYKNDVNLATTSFKDNGYEYFFPQTNFFITKTRGDDLIKESEFDELYFKYISDPEYGKNNNQLEYKYMLAECVLRDFVKRNSLVGKHLINTETYRTLLETILFYRIADSSHKNIFFTDCGICHYHFFDKEIIEI